MRKVDLGKSGLIASEVALGCMRMSDLSVSDAATVISTVMDQGVNFFDHADIYGDGLSEEIFAKAVGQTGIVRDKMILQTKCAIDKGADKKGAVAFNFSKDYVLWSVEESLKRLNTDYIDLLALHRPDILMDPVEVAETFDLLHKQGKVRYFGVSNQTPGQMALLSKYVGHKLIVNQLQLSLLHTGMIDAELNTNMTNDASVDHDRGVLTYCRLHDVSIQAWTPFRASISGAIFLDNPDFAQLNEVLQRVTDAHGVSKDAIAAAWILRIPGGHQVIAGSMNPARLQKIIQAGSVTLTHQEWYDLYRAAGNVLP